METIESKIINSGMSNLDKIVEVVYRNCDCSICKVSGVKCPFAHYTDADEVKDDDYLECKKLIKESIVKAAGEVQQN